MKLPAIQSNIPDTTVMTFVWRMDTWPTTNQARYASAASHPIVVIPSMMAGSQSVPVYPHNRVAWMIARTNASTSIGNQR